MGINSETDTITIYLIKVPGNIFTITEPDLSDPNYSQFQYIFQRVFERIKGTINIQPLYDTTQPNFWDASEKPVVYLKTSSVSFWFSGVASISNMIFNAMELNPSIGCNLPNYFQNPTSFCCQDNGNSPPTPGIHQLSRVARS